MRRGCSGPIFAAFLAVSGLLRADIQFDQAAAVSFPSLQIPQGVRATGMGDAYTALGDDVYSLNWNPAGLSGISGYQLGLADNEWLASLGIRQQLLSYGQSLGPGAAAVSLNYVNLGQLDERDASGALLGHSTASVFAGSLGYGWAMFKGRHLKAGGAFEFVDQSLYGASQSTVGADLGLAYDFSPALSAGLSVNHLGSGTPGLTLPSSLQLGLASWLLKRSLALALDAEIPFNSPALIKAGVEYNLSVLALRLGWRQDLGDSDSSQQSGFTAGAGFQVGDFRLDYSYAPYGDLSNVQRFQATIELPRDIFQAKVVGEEGTSATAATFYASALALEKDGETLKALVEYQRCLESYPDSLKDQPQPFYVDAGKKVEELQAQLSKGGDHSQIQKLTKQALAGADKEMQAGHYKEAVAMLKQARLIDPNSPALDAKLKEARQALDSHLAVYRDAAHFAATEKNLPMGVENYRKLLAIDPSDAEALAYMNKHRAEIKEMLQAIDRKAIYFYVAGQLDEAISTWTEGQAEDYFGDLDFKRNIDKARHQLELRDKK
jgi:hypothetical protein